MSANKLMNRIVVPEDVDYERGDMEHKMHMRQLAENVHNSTFGISSDPLTQFAVVFSAGMYQYQVASLEFYFYCDVFF